MKSNIFSLKKDSLMSYFDSFVSHKDSFVAKNNPFASFTDSTVSRFLQKKIYITDLDQDVTFAGIVQSFKKLNGTINVSLTDVEAYEYSSSNPLFNLPKISFSRPENRLYVEELN